MAKRKREDRNASEAELTIEKKPKRHHSKPKRKPKSSARAGNLNRGVDARSLPTISSNRPSGSQAEILELPPGLSRRQRKRWRKKQKLLAKGVDPGGSRRSQSKPDPKEIRARPQVSTVTESKSQLTERVYPRTFLNAAAVTQLMPRRQREWHQEAEVAKPAKPHKASSVDVSNTKDDRNDMSESDNPSEDEEEIPKSKRSTSNPNDELASSRSSRSSSESIESGAESAPRQPYLLPQSVAQPSLTSRPIEKARPHIGPPSSTAHHTVHATSSIHRSSFSNRATSVPSFSTNSDPVSAFKRFSTFLHKNDSSSDEESDDSDRDDSGNDIKFSKPTEAEQSFVDVRATEEAAVDDQDAVHDLHSFTGLERPKSNGEHETDQLPRLSDAITQPTSANGSTWLANVGVKRQLSFLGQEPGGTPSGSGADPQCDLEPQSLPVPAEQSGLFDINDDSQELLRAVDEISNTVFRSTRTLPASKDTFSSGTGNDGQGNGVLTSASSDRRMTRSMSTPKGTQERTVRNNNVPNPTTVVVDAEVATDQPAASGETYDSQMHDNNAAASDSMSENIDVAIPVLNNDSAMSDSSSSLSELSRSPSPPADAVLSTTNVQQEDKQNSEPYVADAEAVVGITEADTPPRKNRKMTGRTSKHFTPQKMATGKSTSTTQECLIASKDNQADNKIEFEQAVDPQSSISTPVAGSEKPVRRTRATSKAERDEDWERKVQKSDNATATQPEHDTTQSQPEDEPPAHSTRSSIKKRKSTGKRSTYFTPTKHKPILDPTIIDRVDFYNTTFSSKKARVPAGTSIAPVPPISASRFGIIQEKLWQEPFWLLIAVTFLNKTTGRAAVPVFWALKEKYATPEALAKADQAALCEMIHHLGLQNQRSKRMISIARAWIERPPSTGRRGRTLHYPLHGDGKELKPGEVVEDDASGCAGALEIAHLPGCGPYAWDSWRIFCRDVLRDVATDYNGAGGDGGFVAEWKKVVPLDKELRACLRWMWLREGWIWNHESGEKREATEEEMERARRGEMEIHDPLERKFAAQAAGVEVSPFKVEADNADVAIEEKLKLDVDDTPVLPTEQPKTPELQAEEDDNDNIVVTPVVSPVKRKTRRSTRLSI